MLLAFSCKGRWFCPSWLLRPGDEPEEEQENAILDVADDRPDRVPSKTAHPEGLGGRPARAPKSGLTRPAGQRYSPSDGGHQRGIPRIEGLPASCPIGVVESNFLSAISSYGV